MGGRFDLELEPEVELWLNNLSRRHYRTVEANADMLADNPNTLGYPYTSQLDGKLRELRFHLGQNQQRISYWITPDQRVVLLTVFRKTKQREAAEVTRAKKAMDVCAKVHDRANHEYERTFEEE